MTAHALKVEKATKPAKETRGKRRSGRELTLDMIKPESKGAPVAEYLFKHFKNSGLSNTELARALGYESHSNMSMVRNGTAKLPISKAPATVEALDIDNPYEFGRLVAENNMPGEMMALEQLGVVCSEQERKILDIINERVPAGDMEDFTNKLKAFLDS